MPTFPKEAIKQILEGLDHTNDALWTDDGAPLVTEVQRLANDKTITRAQINDAFPGFARKTTDSVPEDVQPDDEAAETKASTDLIIEPVAAGPKMDDEDSDEPLSPEQEHERLRKLALARVHAAEEAVAAAKSAVSEAQRGVQQAEARLTRALQVYSSKYPPISPAEAIKIHLARQQELLRERVTGSRFEPNVAANPVDQTLMDRKRNNGRNGRGPTPGPFLPRKAAVNY